MINERISFMKVIKRIFPVLCITIAVVVITFFLYYDIMKLEKERCWDELSTTAYSVSREITMKFEDEMVKLRLIKDLMIEDGYLDAESIEGVHLDSIQPTTIFYRIDVLFPDGMLVSNGEEAHNVETDIDFEKIAEKGEYVTKRKTDTITGRECIYYVLPVMNESETEVMAVLIGMIDAVELAQIFHPIIYEGQANVCIIDADDGNYIMDSWHEELGNAYGQLDREKAKGYEDVDMEQMLRNGETGAVAFISKTTGKILYMYCMPMEVYGWQLAIFAPEDVIFEYLLSFKKMVLLAGLIEIFLLILYFLWNISTVRQLEKSNAEILRRKEQLKQISYKDMLTSMYNRNKYTEVKNYLRENVIKNIGIVYMDLNGLKQINDLQMHEAGDRYIRDTAHIILNIFDEKSYRIGGDEFVVIADGMGQEEFLQRVNRLQEDMKKGNISISLGLAWEEVCNDLGSLLKSAEQKMYQDKDNYYLTHEKKR